jgi:hypothetical protein
MRRGVTLVELLVIALPALAILGLLVHLLVRTVATDRWQDAKLSGLDAVVIAGEHLRHDAANGREVHQTTARKHRQRATVTCSWDDEPSGLLAVRLAAEGGVTLDTRVHLPDRALRSEHGSWAP